MNPALLVGIILFVALDTAVAGVCLATGGRSRQYRYELVSCPINIALCGYLLFVVGLPWWGNVLVSLWAWTQVFGTFKAAQYLHNPDPDYWKEGV